MQSKKEPRKAPRTGISRKHPAGKTLRKSKVGKKEDEERSDVDSEEVSQSDIDSDQDIKMKAVNKKSASPRKKISSPGKKISSPKKIEQLKYEESSNNLILPY